MTTNKLSCYEEGFQGVVDGVMEGRVFRAGNDGNPDSTYIYTFTPKGEVFPSRILMDPNVPMPVQCVGRVSVELARMGLDLINGKSESIADGRE